MPEQSGEDLRERRRRQNRESQRRWRQRHKKSHSKQTRPRECVADDNLRGTSSLSSLLSPLTSLASDFLPDPRGIADDRVDFKTSWIHKQPAAAEAAEGLPIVPWHMGFTTIGGGDQVDGVLPNQSEILSNKVNEWYGNNHSYMHDAGAGGYPMCSAPFSHLDLSIMREDDEDSRGISRSLSSSNQALVGDHSLDLEENEQNCFSTMIKLEPESQSKELASPAEMAINEVQDLYSMGVKVGFLKRDDKVQDYLAGMKQIYHRAPYLRDGKYRQCFCGCSGNNVYE